MSDACCLVEMTPAGDAPELRSLVEQMLPSVRARVMSTLMRYRSGTLSSAVVDDFTQQVFLVLFEKGGRRLRAWEPARSSLKSFVGLIAEREVVNALRRDRRNPFTELPMDHETLTAHVGVDEGHEARVASRELLETLLDNTLDDRGLLLFQRLLVDEVPADLVAVEMKTTLSALYMWRSRFTKVARAFGRKLERDTARVRSRYHASNCARERA